MSEVYIRSQGKEQLFILNNFTGIRCSEREKGVYFFSTKEAETQNKKHSLFLILHSGEWEKLGEYESKERCIEVLDEIQKICEQYLYAPGNTGLLIGSEATPPMAAVIHRVYQMPEK